MTPMSSAEVELVFRSGTDLQWDFSSDFVEPLKSFHEYSCYGCMLVGYLTQFKEKQSAASETAFLSREISPDKYGKY